MTVNLDSNIEARSPRAWRAGIAVARVAALGVALSAGASLIATAWSGLGRILASHGESMRTAVEGLGRASAGPDLSYATAALIFAFATMAMVTLGLLRREQFATWRIDKDGHALTRREREIIELEQVARAGVWRWPVGSDRLECSPGLSRLLGLGLRETAVAVRSFIGAVHEED
ncbi:MAG: hypothetical protein ACREGL_00810, partial [Alphaproteobacteria bacterium]